mgnify:FL=1
MIMKKQNQIIKDIFLDTSPYHFIKTRFKELIFSKEAFVSALLTVLFQFFLSYCYLNNKVEKFVSFFSPLILTIIGGLIAMIAFSLSALALVISSLNTNEVEQIAQDKGEEGVTVLATIIYRFYLSTLFNLIALFLLIAGYFIVNLNTKWNDIVLVIVGLITIYITIFSLIFSSLLTKTCIRMKFLKYLS